MRFLTAHAGHISEHAKDLVRMLLDVDPKRRITPQVS